MTFTAMQCREAYNTKITMARDALYDDLCKLPRWNIYVATWEQDATFSVMDDATDWETELEVPGATEDDAVEWWVATSRQDRSDYQSIEARPIK